ncbi:uncharacterized protein LOC111619123 [Centruroides sculpturatus]|uniref:uncharacterized protein LOC111619123 n=1 Tax=Centruroides sculpturatus TaxID=218467 RepID=UPI000C6D4C1A|nr:uncharacterized protein LOC111619123 [Centruroides sculpturatus]
MATGLRHLKLPLNRKITNLKSNYFKISNRNKDSNNKTSKRSSWSRHSLYSENLHEISNGVPKALINLCIINRSLQVSLLRTTTEDHIQENLENDINEAHKVTYYLNDTDKKNVMESLNRLILRCPLSECSSYSYDSFNLPVKVYNHWMDDLCIKNEDSTDLNSKITQNFPVTVFSGYLDSSYYQMYCVGMEKENSLLMLSDFEEHFVRNAHSMSSNKVPEPTGRPSEEQLKKVYLSLSNSLPKLFTEVMDYSIYNQNIIFENNIRGVTTHGIAGYVQQMALVRILGHLRYSHVKLEILKITQHPEDGTVRVRWRITGVSGLRVLFMFWKFVLWEWKKMMEKETEWVDGFSVFFIGPDGLVYKHVCDKMMPDEEKVSSKSGNVAMKLALLLGLVPKPIDFGLETFINNFFKKELFYE